MPVRKGNVVPRQKGGRKESYVLGIVLIQEGQAGAGESGGQEVQQDKGWKASLGHCSTEVIADQLGNIDGEVA